MTDPSTTDTPAGGFAGFRSGLGLVSELPGWSREDYHAAKLRIAEELVEPARLLVADVGERLRAAVDADLVWETKVGGSISPLNRDLRFARDTTTLYKDHLMLTWWGGTEKRRSPVLWLRLTADDAGFATGIGLDGPLRDRWREAVAGDSGAELAASVDELVRGTGAEVCGRDLARVPRPFDPDHPRGDLLRHKSFQVRWLEPLPAGVTSRRFVDWTVRRLERCGPIHRWLKTHLG